MHEQEQGLGLHHQGDLLFIAGVAVLMDAGVLDDTGVAGLVGMLHTVVNIGAAAVEDIEHRRIHVPVLLADGAGRQQVDMAFDGLADGYRSRIDHRLGPELRPALPGEVGGGHHPGLGIEALVELAVGAFQGAHEGALLLPEFPHHLALFGAVVAGAGGLCGGGFSLAAVCHGRANRLNGVGFRLMGRPA